MKNKFHPILFIIAAAISLIACGQKEAKNKVGNAVTNKETIKTEAPVHLKLPAKGADILNVSEFADTILYVPLETNSKSLLRRIRQVQINNNHILVTGGDRLLMFSMDGKFIRQIGKNGKGPGEYLSIYDFVADGDTIFISSTGKRSLIKYSINGNFIEELPTPNHFEMTWFDITPEKIFVSYSGQRSGKLFLLDKNLSNIDTLSLDFKAPENPSPYMKIDPYDYAFQYGGEKRFLFTSYMSDTIWNILNGHRNAAYVLNLRNKILPVEYRIENLHGDDERFMKVAAPYQKIKLVETPPFLFLFQKSWTERDINATYIHDMTENTTRKFDTPYIFDNLIGKQNLVPRYTSGNCVVAELSPLELKEELKNNSKKAMAKEDTPSSLWLEQMTKVKENDNQILVIMPVSNKTKVE